MTLDPREIALGLGLCIAVGALVGLERERRARVNDEPSFAGARTFPLIALASALASLISTAVGPVSLLAAFLALVTFLAITRAWQLRNRGEEGLGLTTEIAALVVFGIAALPFLELLELSFQQRLVLTGGLGAVVMTLLALRDPIHGFAERVSPEDVYATVRFILLAVVALPLLPDRSYGPFGFFNPFRLGVVVMLIAGISFIGYVAVRALGARKGIGVTAIFGGLVSSTAVTLTFSQRGKASPALATACALAIVLASTIMFPRILLLAAGTSPGLLPSLAMPVGAMAVVGVLGCVVLWRRAGPPAGKGDAEPRFSNPFTLQGAFKLGLLYAAVRLVAAAAFEYLGQGGLYASSFLAGITDVDAITVSICRMRETGIEASVATTAVTIAAISNTLAKTILAGALGGRKVGQAVAAVLAPAAAVGIVLALTVS